MDLCLGLTPVHPTAALKHKNSPTTASVPNGRLIGFRILRFVLSLALPGSIGSTLSLQVPMSAHPTWALRIVRLVASGIFMMILQFLYITIKSLLSAFLHRVFLRVSADVVVNTSRQIGAICGAAPARAPGRREWPALDPMSRKGKSWLGGHGRG